MDIDRKKKGKGGGLGIGVLYKEIWVGGRGGGLGKYEDLICLLISYVHVHVHTYLCKQQHLSPLLQISFPLIT